jgi:hypothetical protein
MSTYITRSLIIYVSDCRYMPIKRARGATGAVEKSDNKRARRDDATAGPFEKSNHKDHKDNSR